MNRKVWTLLLSGLWLPSIAMADDVHTLMNVSVWGKSPNLTVVSIIVDVKEDQSGVVIRGTASQDGATVNTTWIYVQNKVVATCQHWACNVEVSKDKMDPGLNNILIAFTASDGVSRGTSVFVSRP